MIGVETGAPNWRFLHGPPSTPASRESRKALLIELAVVVLVVFGTSIGSAALDLAGRLVGFPSGGSPFILFIPGHAVLAVVLSCAYLLVRVGAVVALTVYVLHRSGESLRVLGLSLSRKRLDLLLVIPFALLALRLQAFGLHLPRPGQSSFIAGPATAPAIYAVTGVVRSLEAGIVEEIVVLAFVLTRLRQLGVHPLLAILISSVLRASYHLEYGWAALSAMLFGVGMAIMYLGTRRLLPAIAVHTGYDVWATFQNFVFV
jgi:membrane protease YdiL (CAAX protease family)